MSLHTEEHYRAVQQHKARMLTEYQRQQESLGYEALGQAVHLAACAALISHFKPRESDLAYKGDPPRALWLALSYTEAAWAGVSPALVVGRNTRSGSNWARWRVWRTLHLLGYTLSGIARVAGRDHSTIWYGLKRLSGIPLNKREKNV